MHMLQEKPYEAGHMMGHGVKGHWETQLLASLLQERETPLSPHSCCPRTSAEQMHLRGGVQCLPLATEETLLMTKQHSEVNLIPLISTNKK